MADNQRGQRGQNQNQDMNRSSGSNLGNDQRADSKGRPKTQDQKTNLKKEWEEQEIQDLKTVVRKTFAETETGRES